VSRSLDAPYAFAPAERIDVRVELLNAMTGETVTGVDLTDVRKNRVDGDMSDRLFGMIGGMVVSGLETGRVRAFRVATATADS
jgi:hypothetical protein